MFHRVLILFLVLGVLPTLIISILFALPYHLQFYQYKNVVGILLVISTVSTLCLAGIVTKLLKKPIDELLFAQKTMEEGEVWYRIEKKGSDEFGQLFLGFNRMAEAIEDAQEKERLHTEQQAFTKMARSVVHDMGSPLMGFDFLSKYFFSVKSEDPDWSKNTELLQICSKRLMDITNSLLNPKKEEEGPKVLYVEQVLDELVSEYQAQKKYGRVVFLKEYFSTTPTVFGNRTKLQRAFANLIKNSIEALQSEGVIVLKTFVEEKMVSVMIDDNGPGVPFEIKEKILQGGYSTKASGHGIGLSVMQEVAKEFGGSFSLFPSSNGTKAVMYFPQHIDE